MAKQEVAVSKKSGAEVAKIDPRMAEYDDLMDEADVQSDNIIIPKILITQAMSERAMEGLNAVGDIVGSLEGNLLANKEGTFEFIPFRYFQTWVVKRVVNGKEEFDGVIPWTKENSTLPREEIKNVDGQDVIFKNYAAINYYVLLNKELEAGEYMPYVITFQSYNSGVGKKLESHRARLKTFKTPLSFKTFSMGTTDKENDKGKFKIFSLSTTIRDTTNEELACVRKWHALIASKPEAVKVDDSEYMEAESEPAAKSSNSTPPKFDENDVPF